MNRPSHPGDSRTSDGAATAGRTTAMVGKTWTAERIRALGAVTNVTTAAEIFGLSRDTAYHLARAGQFPVPVLRVGRQLRVPIAPILALLNLPAEAPQPRDPPPSDEPPKPAHHNAPDR